MATIYYDADADLSPLKGRPIAILGYGSQGHAHALNLRDSGMDVRVGLPEASLSRRKVTGAGLRCLTAAEACKEAQVIMVLAPDQTQRALYEESIRQELSAGKALFFAHGFNIHFNCIQPPKDVDVILIAPKAPGHLVRRTFEEGQGTPALIAVHQDATGKALSTGLAYGKALGATRAGLLATTFAEETETDLFGEQVVLCGGVTELVRAGFDTLTEAGYQPESAYFECLHELKLIVDMMYEGGIKWMRHSISDTAEYGDMTRGKRIITAETRREMKRILEEIQSGAFAKEWILENQAGRPHFLAERRRQGAHPIEAVGERLRAMMSWIKTKRKDSSEPDARDAISTTASDPGPSPAAESQAARGATTAHAGGHVREEQRSAAPRIGRTATGGI